MSDRINDLLEQATVKYTEAKALLTADACSAEDMDQADKLREEADGLKARASQLKKIELGAASAVPQQREQDQTPAGFKDWREFVGAVALAVRTQGKAVDPRLKTFEEPADERKDLAGSSGSGGGLLIPQTQMTEIMSVAEPMTVVRSRATRIAMSSRLVRIPVLDQTSTTAGSPHFFGGINVAWTEEGATMGETDPAFREAELVARELVGATTVTNSLMKDVPALASFLGSRRGFPGAIAWQEDRAFLRGDGVGKPLGILNAQCTKAVTRTSTNHIKFEDLANMEASFMGEEPVWIGSISTKAELLTMNGPSGNPSYLWGNAATGVPNTLLGHPILWTDKLPALGALGDLILADLSYYIVATLEEGTSLESSPHQKFTSNKTVFRIVHRVDGQPWLSKVVTLTDGTTTLSPFVQIAA
jgi:HK97 family phage major capsid protein